MAVVIEIVFAVSYINSYLIAFIGVLSGSYSALVSFCFISRFHGIGIYCPTLQPSQELLAKVAKLLAKQGPFTSGLSKILVPGRYL